MQRSVRREIELVDDAGAPVAGVAYRVIAADGSVHRGVLDADGRGRVDGVPPGDCKVSFPALHGDEWEGN